MYLIKEKLNGRYHEKRNMCKCICRVRFGVQFYEYLRICEWENAVNRKKKPKKKKNTKTK